ncbi:galactose mutarotase-like structural superfamily protein [Zymomonas mobilis subsp. mobilis ZM4 = ATCC 31821]|uniref:Aldose 1-epimerase n=2 Tax=Zymomonas mobilis subsp. mobilis TaxID=120045 RepID=Q5NNZ1_ZYMMO|nr:aldose 1-epimerase family protein [Zymomonas mobilis]AAV89569.1 Aldose 1-epimerase [Zymomonas mobilis subsp. mobilis ZM4 = ATCC 31821]AEH62208.1 Aldose 1-epimerase [Zymomonas mobilis subsp. mobilis ATCC 10988]ART92862.1 aldose epimerase [Zymomonas mobilis subsp. mobilis]AVZ25861.1 galactose mutarotase-like structural superfamily protein [Zymomonas mobilis subsp. mobilis]AVZ27752.1 galactose mutarotase-like structural superfamily protein [Zymomonas mobilis subsp. mobilis]
MSKIITIKNNSLTLDISTSGAEMQRIEDADGQQWLWDGNPEIWSGHAPFLFPIVGTLVQNQYRLGDKSYELPRHGFARRKAFDPIVIEADHACFRLKDDSETRAVYPFLFTLDIDYRLKENSLTIEAKVTNNGDSPMPASFGFHPALRWPLPTGADRKNHIVLFEKAEIGTISGVDSDGLFVSPRENPVHDRTVILNDDLFNDDALIFDKVASRSVWMGAPGYKGAIVRFPLMPSLALWMKPGADYLCIEPWQGHSDPAGFKGDIFEKPGIVPIKPKESRSFGIEILINVDEDDL